MSSKDLLMKSSKLSVNVSGWVLRMGRVKMLSKLKENQPGDSTQGRAECQVRLSKCAGRGVNMEGN